MSVMVLLTSGEYSDYGVIGFYEIPSYQWVDERLREYLEAHPDQAQEYHFKESQFANWLLSLDGVREVQYLEGHLGAYGTAPKTVFDKGLMDSGPPEVPHGK